MRQFKGKSSSNLHDLMKDRRTKRVLREIYRMDRGQAEIVSYTDVDKLALRISLTHESCKHGVGNRSSSQSSISMQDSG